MLDHLEFGVKDLKKSRAFYIAALAPLGLHLVVDAPGVIGFASGAIRGADGKERVELLLEEKQKTPSPLHLAFRATSRAAVDAFYRGALAGGGTDNGAPGVRSEYHAGYYGAFVRDPDGHNVEAVYHG